MHKKTLADLIDFEFFFAQDEGKDLSALRQRDREIFTSFPADAEKNPPHEELLRHWLARRREEKPLSSLPGTIWQELLTLFSWMSLLLGLLTGGLLAFSFLSYSGSQPVNVAAYFALFVVVQVLFFLLLLASFALARLRTKNVLESSLLYGMVRTLFTKLLDRCLCAVKERLSGEKRLQWSAQVFGLERVQERYGLLFLRPFFLLVQGFGLSFNLGVLLATLLKVIGSDLAFGWQSTLQITAPSIHSLLTWISLPWSWLPERFIPSLAQIEGSRLILKDGIYHLTSQDLAAWWPFLCLSVLFYGFFPRLLLLLLGSFRQAQDLKKISCDQGPFRQLLHRMQTPLVSTTARFEAGPKAQQHATGPAPSIFSKPAQAFEAPMVALIPDELVASCSFTELAAQLQQRSGYQLRQLLPFWTLDGDEEAEVTDLLAARLKHQADVCMIQEAWQPPIQELLLLLRLIRQQLGPQPLLLLALVGKPRADTILTPVQPENLRVWQHKLAQLQDQGLQLMELVSP
jgi:hypothetical protein